LAQADHEVSPGAEQDQVRRDPPGRIRVALADRTFGLGQVGDHVCFIGRPGLAVRHFFGSVFG
jgi:hypothetical protein